MELIYKNNNDVSYSDYNAKTNITRIIDVCEKNNNDFILRCYNKHIDFLESLMLNSNFIDFLKVINKFADTIIMRYPVTCGISEDKDIVYSFNIENFDKNSFDQELGIAKLSSFLNMFQLFKPSREVEIENNIIKVHDEDTQAQYILSKPLVLSQYDAKEEQFVLTEKIPSVLEFELTQEMLKKLKNATSVFSELNTMVVEGSDISSVYLVQTESREKMSSNSFKIIINKNAEKNFKTGIGTLTLSKLPLSDYLVKVKYNEAKGKYRILLESKSIKDFKIILPTKANLNI